MRSAFVTGGSGHIGRAVCKKLAEDGFAVAVGYYNNRSAADIVTALIRQNGGTAMSVKCDVTDPESLSSAKGVIDSQLGSPEVLVCCAGQAEIGLFTDLPLSRIGQIIETDLLGVMLACREFIPSMVKNHNGSVINISSIWGERGASCEAVYSAAKAGVIGFTKALGKELAPSNIRVNCVSPGFIDTKMNNTLSPAEKQAFIDDIPLSRAGTPEEVAAVVSFLASDASSYITAENISVNGGL